MNVQKILDANRPSQDLLESFSKIVELEKAKEQFTEIDQLIIDLYELDWYYGYSDDRNVYEGGLKRELALKEKVKAVPELQQYLDLWGDVDKLITKLKEHPTIQTLLELSKLKSSRWYYIWESGFPIDSIMNAQRIVLEFCALIHTLPDALECGCFIWTPYRTPPQRELRNKDIYFDFRPIALPEVHQAKITEYFLKNNKLKKSLKILNRKNMYPRVVCKDEPFYRIVLARFENEKEFIYINDTRKSYRFFV